ncbi:MAG TPA: cupin domain-containing protein [Thermoleophilaceae bacterium]|nr:cupin domain-containing protein [Thermoleophilaceae bacterium]
MSWKHGNLRDSEDLAAKYGYGDIQEARFPRKELGAESTGLGYIALRPGKRQPFAHRHEAAEEIYVILSGDGRLKLDDEILEVGPMDAVRVAPEVTRAFEAGEEGLEILVFGPRHAGDAETVQDFW